MNKERIDELFIANYANLGLKLENYSERMSLVTRELSASALRGLVAAG